MQKINVVSATLALLAVACLGGALAANPASKEQRKSAVQSPGKPGAEVMLSASVVPGASGKAAVAAMLEVELDFAVPADAQSLQIRVTSPDSVTLVSGAEAYQVLKGQPVTHQVMVIPNAEGRHYLSVNVVLQRYGEHRMRSFAVPFDVGVTTKGPRPATKGRLTRNSDGEAVVITRSR